jgi:hypothetical protein
MASRHRRYGREDPFATGRALPAIDGLDRAHRVLLRRVDLLRRGSAAAVATHVPHREEAAHARLARRVVDAHVTEAGATAAFAAIVGWFDEGWVAAVERPG